MASGKVMLCHVCYMSYALRFWHVQSEVQSSQIEGFLVPGAAGAQFKVSQYADDTTVFVKDESSLIYLFKAISLYEKGSGARLNISKT